MPITRSAKKALRTSLKKRAFNDSRKTSASKAIKEVKRFAAAGKKKEAAAALRLAQKALDKAAKTHALDKNTVSRRKSRLSAIVKKIA
jgi:small subunit ribosomal protein S20